MVAYAIESLEDSTEKKSVSVMQLIDFRKNWIVHCIIGLKVGAGERVDT